MAETLKLFFGHSILDVSVNYEVQIHMLYSVRDTKKSCKREKKGYHIS
jgi:hypothetical protein